MEIIYKPYTYLVRFKPTGQVYYGVRSKNVKLKKTPQEDLMINYHTSCKRIKQLIKEHGINEFEWEVRKEFDTIEKALAWEVKVLRRCNVLKDSRWFNQNVAGFIVPSRSGLETIRKAIQGKIWIRKEGEIDKRILPEELPIYESQGWSRGRGRFPEHMKERTQEHRQHLSQALKGKMVGENHPLWGTHRTEEQNKHHSELMKGKPSYWKGKHHTEETKKKISDIKKEHVYTEEEIERLRKHQHDTFFGKKYSEEHKRHISEGLKGKSKSEEHCRHLSESQKGRKRDPSKVARGEKVGSSVLEESQVLEIRKLYEEGKMGMPELALKYGVSGFAIFQIVHGNTWKHI